MRKLLTYICALVYIGFLGAQTDSIPPQPLVAAPIISQENAANKTVPVASQEDIEKDAALLSKSLIDNIGFNNNQASQVEYEQGFVRLLQAQEFVELRAKLDVIAVPTAVAVDIGEVPPSASVQEATVPPDPNEQALTLEVSQAEDLAPIAEIDVAEIDDRDESSYDDDGLSKRKSKKKLYRIRGPSEYDSRVEIRELNPLIEAQYNILKNAQSVGVIIEKTNIHLITDSIYQLDIFTTLRGRYGLCAHEAYGDQPVVGSGTAFVLNDSIMATAGHIFTEPVENYLVVFGFEIANKFGTFDPFVKASSVFSIKRILPIGETDMDVTFFAVDRPLNVPPLKLASSQNLLNETPVYMLGYPKGMPKKLATNASITDCYHFDFFYTSLDAFQGNSGSPVFREQTNEVIGILVSGAVDYKWNGNCNESTICVAPYCAGEKVMRIERAIEPLIQYLGRD